MKKLKPLITRNFKTKKEMDAYLLGASDCMGAYETLRKRAAKKDGAKAR